MKKIIFLFLGFIQFTFGQNTEFAKQNLFSKGDNSIITLTNEEKKEMAVVVKELNFIEVMEDSTSELKNYFGAYKRVHLNNGSAIDRFNKIILPIASKNDLLMIKARSVSPKGIIKEIGNESVKEVIEDEKVYNMLAFEGLEEGGEIEYFYQIKTDVRTYGSQDFQNELTVRNSEFKIISPDYLVYDLKLYNSNEAQVINSKDKKRIISVTLLNIQPNFEEKYTTGQANDIRLEYQLQYNKSHGEEKYFSWQIAGEKMITFLTEDLENSIKTIEKIAKKEKISGKNDDLKIRAIENYIKSNFSQKEDSDVNNIDEIIQNKYGSINGINKLYISFFEALKVPFNVVIGVNRFKRKFDKEFETWNALDNSIFYFPSVNKYLDPNNPFIRLGIIDGGMEGNDALFITPAASQNLKSAITEIKTIPFSTSKENYDNILAEINFNTDLNAIKVNTKRYFGGLQAGPLKGYFMVSNDEQKNAISKEILKSTLTQDAVFENIKIENTDLNNLKEVDEPMILSADASITSMIEKAGNKIFFQLGEIIGPQVEMYNERPRQQEIDVNTAHKYDRKIIVNIPEGYKIKGLEKIKRNLVFNHENKPAMGFISDYQQKDNFLTVTIIEFYDQVFLPKSAYDDFQKVINAAADFNKIVLVLEKSN